VTALFLALMMGAKSCPWMTAATADRILGGQSTSAVSPKSCYFAHEKSFLRIEVFASSPQLRPYLKVCKSTPGFVKGIGNEAAVCDGSNSAQVAVGRVREQVFVLTLKAPFSRDLLRAKVRAVADLVSGNLY
jgi:hypothetical protein